MIAVEEIGIAPYDQKGIVRINSDKEYIDDMFLQATRFKKMLEDKFINKPESVQFTVDLGFHEFGEFWVVNCIYDETNKKSIKFVDFVCDHIPATWDDVDIMDWKK
jgi:hypothetical protein